MTDLAPGFEDWLAYRGVATFGEEWYTKETFTHKDIFYRLLRKTNHKWAIDNMNVPMPEGYEDRTSQKFLFSRVEAMVIWHWAYTEGWFNAMEKEE